MSNVRVNVRVVDLIAQVEKQRAAAEKKHEKASREFDAHFEKYRAGAIKWAQELKPEDNTYGPPRDRPYRPANDLSKFDRDLALLRMASDESIAITSSSDFYKYIA